MSKTTEKRISEKELLHELKSMIKENYVVIVEDKENALVLRYLNGQRFSLRIEELTA